MKNRRKHPALVAGAAVLAGTLLGLGVTACDNDSDVASDNLSKDADNFKIPRKIVFYNGITDKYIFEADGYCSVKGADRDDEIAVICKTGKDKYVKHILSKSDNVTWFELQTKSAYASTKHYKVIFKPSVVIPDVEAR